MKRSAASLLLALSACTVGPDYHRPATSAPEAWSETAVPNGGLKVDPVAADLTRWWTVFGDSVLDGLVERAVGANLDLKSADARLREARAQLGVVQGALLPEIEAGGAYSRSKWSENALQFPADLRQSSYRVGFDAAWEIDLFGSTRRAIEAADRDAEAWVENRRAVLVSLLGEVARNYVGVRGNQRLLAVLRENVASARGTLDLTQARLQAGVATALDVARAEAQHAATVSAMPPVETALRQTIHRLGVLLGRPPQALLAELAAEAPIPAAPPQVVIGLPSELLLRRPDVRLAERQLAAQTSRIGVATAELYPKISLTGAFGFESLEADDLFKSGSQAWAFGPSVRWPIFTAGRIRAQIRVEEERAVQAATAFESSVLRALEEVENAIVAYLRTGSRQRSLAEVVRANKQAVELATDLYQKGIVSFLDVLDAQRALYLAQAELARAEADVTLNLVALYKSLGGGWEVPKS